MRVTHFEVLGIADIAEDGVIVESGPTQVLDVHDVALFCVKSHAQYLPHKFRESKPLCSCA